MLLRLALLLEILAVVVCIHCVYGRKIKPDIPTIVFCLVSMIILDIINTYKINNISTSVIYVLIFVYCLWEFRQTIIVTIVNEVLFLIIISVMQFICLVFVEKFIDNHEEIRAIICNILVLGFCVFLLPRFKSRELLRNLHTRNGFTIVTIGFAVIALLMMQNKLYEGVQVEAFILVVPAVICLLFLANKWSALKFSAERIELESKLNKNMQDKCTELMTRVQLRQHEFKNHIASLFSMHYSYHTYEQLVQAQKEYSGKVEYENRYNNLLLLENGFLCGFLYGKFQDIEETGIKIDYKICAQIKKEVLPAYYLIEMLGILLDNAAEALKDTEDKRIRFLVEENEEEYRFIISNPYRYVSYAEIEKWFQMGVSKKGAQRGIGLYHLKELCAEWKCRITCQNIDVDENNWIKFILEIDKEGHCIE